MTNIIKTRPNCQFIKKATIIEIIVKEITLTRSHKQCVMIVLKSLTSVIKTSVNFPILLLSK